MVQTLMVPDPLADLARLEGVPTAVAATRDAVDLLVREAAVRAVPTERTVEALVAGARANADLSAEPDRWLAGCLRLATELMALSALIRVAPGQALARAHALVVTGSVAGDRVGRPRGSPEVAERMNGLAALLTGPTEAPAMVLAALTHAEVATLRPFGEADDIVARAAERMVLITTGVDPLGLVVTEGGHARRPGDYRQRLAGYADGSVAGVRAWMLHCLTAYADGAGLSPVRWRVRGRT